MAKLSDDDPQHKRGPRESRGVMVQRIVEAARNAFAERGYDATSLRAVATAANVNPRLVGYYFESKEALLEACLVPPPGFLESVAAVAGSDLSSRGEALVRSVLKQWQNPATARVLRTIILIAAHNSIALDRLRLIVSGGLMGAVAVNLDDRERAVRGGLVATQLLGLAMTRYVWGIEPIASLPADEIVASIAPTIQRYLTADLRLPSV
jgi:AcrR family transcriptional regulator